MSLGLHSVQEAITNCPAMKLCVRQTQRQIEWSPIVVKDVENASKQSQTLTIKMASGATLLASQLLPVNPSLAPKLQGRLLPKVSEMPISYYLYAVYMSPLAVFLKLEEHFLLLRANQVLIGIEAVQQLGWMSVFANLGDVFP